MLELDSLIAPPGDVSVTTDAVLLALLDPGSAADVHALDVATQTAEEVATRSEVEQTLQTIQEQMRELLACKLRPLEDELRKLRAQKTTSEAEMADLKLKEKAWHGRVFFSGRRR